MVPAAGTEGGGGLSEVTVPVVMVGARDGEHLLRTRATRCSVELEWHPQGGSDSEQDS